MVRAPLSPPDQRQLDGNGKRELYFLDLALCSNLTVCENLWSIASLHVRTMWGVLFSVLTDSYSPLFLESDLRDQIFFLCAFKAVFKKKKKLFFTYTAPWGFSVLAEELRESRQSSHFLYLAAHIAKYGSDLEITVNRNERQP